MRRRVTQTALTVLASLLAAGLAGACGGGSDPGGGASPDAFPGEGKPPVTIGTKDFPEQFILGELYAQALEAEGYTVNLRKNIGPTEVVDDALTSGEIDAYPEYLGVAISVVAGEHEAFVERESDVQARPRVL